MAEVIDITPFRLEGEACASIPGSKSITNRALILAALNDGPIELHGALFSDDTQYMIESLKKMGFQVNFNKDTAKIQITGLGGIIPTKQTDIYIGNAGTAARFLTAMLASKKGGEYHLDGSEAMRKRPMKGLLEFLAAKGSEFVFHQEEWHFPFTMKTRGLKGGLWEVDASASSQILSALMMVAPLCEEAVTIRLIGDTVSKPFIQMTADMMKQFGAEIECKNDYHCPENSHYRRTEPEYQIEPDATAASYFFTLPYVAGGQIRIEGLEKNPLQGDIDYLKILTSLGFYVEWDRNIIRVIAPNSLVNGGHFDFNPISDTFLTLAAISPILKTPTTITGIAHTRKQETDRISAMATELKKLGQDVTETEDSIHIKPSIENLKMAAQKNPIIHTYEDHRVAMSFGILGSYNLFGDLRPWLKIEDPYCCAKTFPHFFKELEKIRLS